jgi:hypothetical protein
MNGRTVVRVVATLALVAVAIGIGTAVYNAGVTAGITQAAQQALASGDPVPVVPYGYGYGPYWHPFGFGWGFFGIIFWILGIFLVIGLVRAAFGGRRHGPRGPGGWGDGPYGRGGSVEEWHRDLHRRQDAPGAETAGSPGEA